MERKGHVKLSRGPYSNIPHIWRSHQQEGLGHHTKTPYIWRHHQSYGGGTRLKHFPIQAPRQGYGKRGDCSKALHGGDTLLKHYTSAVPPPACCSLFVIDETHCNIVSLLTFLRVVCSYSLI